MRERGGEWKSHPEMMDHRQNPSSGLGEEKSPPVQARESGVRTLRQHVLSLRPPRGEEAKESP